MIPIKHDRLAIGVALMSQRVGFAVLSRERLVTFAVADVGKQRTADGRSLAFRVGLHRRLKTHAVSHLALVPPPVLRQTFAKAAVTVVDELAREHRLNLQTYSRVALRRRGGGTYRRLTSGLLVRYPELRARVRMRTEIPGYRGLTTSHEVPIWALALAISAAEQALADALTPELPLATPDPSSSRL